MKIIISVIAAALLSACATQLSTRESMQADIDQAAAIIERFEAMPEKAIPPVGHKGSQGFGDSYRHKGRVYW